MNCENAPHKYTLIIECIELIFRKTNFPVEDNCIFILGRLDATEDNGYDYKDQVLLL